MNQCRHIMDIGVRCKRRFKSKQKYCHMHQKNKKNKKNKKNISSTTFEYDDLIGEGSFGCIYKPPLKCVDEPNLNKKYDKDVMKFMNDNEYARAEKCISNIINRIDPDQEYFIALSKDQCTINMEIEKGQINACRNYKRSAMKNKFIGFFIKNGGITLSRYIILNQNNVNSIHNIFKIMLHLFRGLSILHKNNIVHRDLKANNIVVSRDNIARIIDFGQAKIINVNDKDYKKKIYEDIDDLMISFFGIKSFCWEQSEKWKIVYENYTTLKYKIIENRQKYNITIEEIIEYINNRIMPYIKE